LRIVRRRERAVVAVDDLGQAADAGRDDGQPRRHRLEDDARVVLVAAREDEEVGRAHLRRELLLRHQAVERDGSPDAEPLRELFVPRP
jgi:hypothetical protein